MRQQAESVALTVGGGFAVGFLYRVTVTEFPNWTAFVAGGIALVLIITWMKMMFAGQKYNTMIVCAYYNAKTAETASDWVTGWQTSMSTMNIDGREYVLVKKEVPTFILRPDGTYDVFIVLHGRRK